MKDYRVLMSRKEFRGERYNYWVFGEANNFNELIEKLYLNEVLEGKYKSFRQFWCKWGEGEVPSNIFERWNKSVLDIPFILKIYEDGKMIYDHR